MAEEEHLNLSSTIKDVHKELRVQSKKIGPSAAWQAHCSSKPLLQRYSSSMRKLAETHWSQNNGNDARRCRISWVVSKAEEYFVRGGWRKAMEKEKSLYRRFFGRELHSDGEMVLGERIKLLDVGSCYNPFRAYAMFDVTALDIAPASEDVLECDFLSIQFGSTLRCNAGACYQLEAEGFEIVVFSLVLEYLPSPRQRYEMCDRAFRALKPGGLLFILTPDSKHATANSKLLKGWKYALASLGFWRTCLEKLSHLHCMAFRKCHIPTIPQRWLSQQPTPSKLPQDLILIPQDFNDYEHAEEPKTVTRKEQCDMPTIMGNFEALPSENCYN